MISANFDQACLEPLKPELDKIQEAVGDIEITFRELRDDPWPHVYAIKVINPEVRLLTASGAVFSFGSAAPSLRESIELLAKELDYGEIVYTSYYGPGPIPAHIPMKRKAA